MAEKTGRFAIIEQFLTDGMNYMFGNPGTVEQGFLDALPEYPEMKYILALHESVALLIFVICNNQSYMLLKLNIMQYWKEQNIEEHVFPKLFNLTDPVIDFAALAQSMGVPGVRVKKPGEVGPAIEKALNHNGPFLIDLVIRDHVAGSKINCKCGQ